MNESKPRSFWGRVTEFVKNPTQDWALTRHENALQEQREQEKAKAREEQRRLDAFIRRRELASLRRLRKRQADGLPVEADYTDIPDTGTGPSAPEREATLRKINEIERAMSDDARPGRRHRPTRGAPTRPSLPASESDAIRLGGAKPPGSTLPQLTNLSEPLAFPVTDLQSRHTGPHGSKETTLEFDIDPTVPAPTQMAPTHLAATQPGATLLGAGGAMAPARASELWTRNGGYGMGGAMAVDVQEGVSSSPLFDQACIDFANGHDEDAERALLSAISGSPERDLENEFWLALFDLYRASDNQARFDALVADYVDRFQTSAPAWRLSVQAATAPAAPAGTTAQLSTFTALGELDAAQSRALLLLARSGAPQVALDFSALTAILPGAQTFALEALKTLNAAAGCAIELSGLANLTDACAVAAPPMQRDADPAWWGLRMEALRMAGSEEAFENAALDYCVTYEISPPPWEPSRAKVRIVNGEAALRGVPTQPPTGAANSQFASTGFGNTTTGIAIAKLSGEIRGGNEDFLKPLDRAAGGGRVGIVVNLLGLRRLDFASAGVMLNWVMAQNSAGRSVRFEGTHRLIAGLFVILGINSVAQIDLRRS
jgi:anti-anti-sigma regulatory factor